jgi:DNA-binding CsgD family transcriptional regulator
MRHGISLPKPKVMASDATVSHSQSAGPGGERALFTITTNANDEHWHRWRYAHLHDFHLLAHYFHERTMRFSGLRQDHVMRPLSPREKQCLENLTRGLAPGQIVASLHLSVSAVHTYLRTARRKLECATIEQAVAKAIRFDLI